MVNEAQKSGRDANAQDGFVAVSRSGARNSGRRAGRVARCQSDDAGRLLRSRHAAMPDSTAEDHAGPVAGSSLVNARYHIGRANIRTRILKATQFPAVRQC